MEAEKEGNYKEGLSIQRRNLSEFVLECRGIGLFLVKLAPLLAKAGIFMTTSTCSCVFSLDQTFHRENKRLCGC